MNKFLRWFILGITLFFLVKTFQDNWLQVSNIHIDQRGWLMLILANLITLLAHIWAGYVWTLILTAFGENVPTFEFICVYLKTNVAKYLPGNIWHYYGRVMAAKNANVATEVATVSVLLEPLMMLASAVILIIIFSGNLVISSWNYGVIFLQCLLLFVVLFTIHPRCLNWLIKFLNSWKNRKKQKNQIYSLENNSDIINSYPVIPLLGELVFLGLRGTGFIMTISALSSLSWEQIPLLFGAFTCAWVLGLVIPGAPSGLGVFETTAILLLQSKWEMALIISAIALYRLISILAEIIGAAIATLIIDN